MNTKGSTKYGRCEPNAGSDEQSVSVRLSTVVYDG